MRRALLNPRLPVLIKERADVYKSRDERGVSRSSSILIVLLSICFIVAFQGGLDLAHAKPRRDEIKPADCAGTLLSLLFEVYPLQDAKGTVDELKALLLPELQAQWEAGLRPLAYTSMEPSSKQGLSALVNKVEDKLDLPSSSRLGSPLTSAVAIRIARHLIESARLDEEREAIIERGLSKQHETSRVGSGLLESAFALALDNLAHLKRKPFRPSKKTLKALRKTLSLLKEAAQIEKKQALRGRWESEEKHLILWLGITLCHLGLDQLDEAKNSLRELFITPSPAEALLINLDLIHPSADRAKTEIFDLQRLGHSTDAQHAWVNTFAELDQQLERWSSLFRDSRARQRRLKAGVRDLILKLPQLKQWWQQNAPAIRVELNQAEERLARAELLIVSVLVKQQAQVAAREQSELEWIQLPQGELLVPDLKNPELFSSVKFDDPFFMAKSEVTVEQYQRCVDAGECTPPEWDTCEIWNGTRFQVKRAPEKLRGPKQPVVCITWSQAKRFSQWIGGDLPSESEWIYAAQSGGKGSTYPWGEMSPTCDVAVMHGSTGAGCGQARSWNVCSRPLGESEQGLCDLSGNVWEWLADQAEYDGKTLISPQFPSNGSPRCSSDECDDPSGAHVAHGGGWGSGKGYLGNTARTAFRGVKRHPFLGFRPVLRR